MLKSMLAMMLIVTNLTALNIDIFDLKHPEYELYSGYATAYCINGTTASGIQTRKGICAGKKEWIGKLAIVYQKLPGGEIGEIIGYYEVMDTGGTNGIKNGNVLDIWQPDLDSCQDFMDRVYEDGCKGQIYFQIIDAEG